MATTASALTNGGSSGGLLSSKTPPFPSDLHDGLKEETSAADPLDIALHLDSNSSFESGQEESRPGPWPKDSDYFEGEGRGASGKKRRKQSRPVRIPASELHHQLLQDYHDQMAQMAHLHGEEVLKQGFFSQAPLNLSKSEEKAGTNSPLFSSPFSLFPPTTLFPANPPSGTPTSTSSAGSNQNSGPAPGPLGPPHRIFNPEAYCDLCNKEFCNKYFLKTHKANKHGVYTDGPSAPPMLTTQNSANSPPFGPKGENLQLPHSDQMFGGEQGGVNQRESFCELCQKQFCNKYFLKRHKAKIHGIPMGPNPGGTGKRNGDPKLPSSLIMENLAGMDLALSRSLLDNEDYSNESGEGHLANLVDQLEDGSDGEIDMKHSIGNHLACTFCGRQFTNKLDLRTHMDKKHGGQTQPTFGSFPFLPPIIPRGLFADSCDPAASLNNNGKKNEEFECTLCSRSFQTVYLLRMHKSYFHPEAEERAEQARERKQQQLEEDHLQQKKLLEMESRGEGTSDSDDLRRLQSMILELNRVSGGGGVGGDWSPPGTAEAVEEPTPPPPSVCPFCAKEFYSAHFLQQHLEAFHSANNGKEVEGSEEDIKDVKKECEGLNLSADFLAPTSGGGSIKGGSAANKDSAKRPSPSLSRSYCTICHKELCNKYFMRTHMLKMHGISIESSTGLGGVTCDICNKELCSKYFLKVHKQNTHGILDEGPSPPAGPPPPVLNLSTTDPDPPVVTSSVSILTSLQPDSQNRYFCHYPEVCPLCRRRFRNAKWLKSHLLGDHGEEGIERWKAIEKGSQQQPRRPSQSSKGGKKGKGKNKCGLCGFSTADVDVFQVHLLKEHGERKKSSEDPVVVESQQVSAADPLALLFQKMEGGANRLYRCSFCPFSTSVLVYLYAHERNHTGLANSLSALSETGQGKTLFQCPMCFHSFHQLEVFQQHLIGHQMSGVLAPFLTPSATNEGLAGPVPPFRDPEPAFPPAFNGATTNLYWALKQEGKKEKRKKNVYRCSACSLTFPSRDDVSGHIKEAHGTSRENRLRRLRAIVKKKKRGMRFKCLKCTFSAASYEPLLVHSKVRHSNPRISHRLLGSKDIPEGRGFPQGEGNFEMQGFLLTSSALEEANEGEYFIPSIVYLPVREKVSQAIRVSFSLTPTT